jgi:hypothetical protein
MSQNKRVYKNKYRLIIPTTKERKIMKKLKQSMVIVAAALMACSFGCTSNPETTSEKMNKEETTVAKPAKAETKEVADKATAEKVKPLEKMNQEATKAGDSLNKTVKKVSDRAGEVANEAGDAINNAIETTSAEVSKKMTKEEDK